MSAMTKEQLFTVIQSPVISEKATLASQNHQVHTFKVRMDAGKSDIKRAIELLFSVNVLKVRVVRIKGKAKRFRGRLGQKNAIKKAYVQLAEGQAIDLSAS